MDLCGRQKGGCVRTQVRGQKRGEQNACSVGHRLSAGPGVAAQHHDEYNAILADELGRAGSRFGRIVFVVVCNEFHHSVLAAYVDSAVRIHPFTPDAAAVEPGFSPRGDRPCKRREKANLDCLMAARNSASGNCEAESAESGQCGRRLDEFAARMRPGNEVRKHCSSNCCYTNRGCAGIRSVGRSHPLRRFKASKFMRGFNCELELDSDHAGDSKFSLLADDSPRRIKRACFHGKTTEVRVAGRRLFRIFGKSGTPKLNSNVARMHSTHHNRIG